MPDAEGVPVRLRAHPKLTLSLRVGGSRPDGFHELDALAISLAGPCDLVELALSDDGRSTLQVATDDPSVPVDSDNLAARAARLLLARIEPGAGVHVRLRKHIPAGAGLGGGSADAAAVLVGIARLLPDEAAGVDLAAVGAELGSDVPFCVAGGAARMRGRGEVLEPRRPLSGFDVVVVVPPARLSTAAVYRAWDELGGPTSDHAVVGPLVDGEPITLANDLEPAAFAVDPALDDLRTQLDRASGLAFVLAGSGSGLFAIAPAGTGHDILARMQTNLPMIDEAGWCVVATTPADAGVSPLAAGTA